MRKQKKKHTVLKVILLIVLILLLVATGGAFWVYQKFSDTVGEMNTGNWKAINLRSTSR